MEAVGFSSPFSGDKFLAFTYLQEKAKTYMKFSSPFSGDKFLAGPQIRRYHVETGPVLVSF